MEFSSSFLNKVKFEESALMAKTQSRVSLRHPPAPRLLKKCIKLERFRNFLMDLFLVLKQLI